MNSITKLFSLKNKTVILTGSAGRLGSRFAHVLTDAGADVVLVDIDEQKNRKLEKSLIKKYGMLMVKNLKDLIRKIIRMLNVKQYYKKCGDNLHRSYQILKKKIWENGLGL